MKGNVQTDTLWSETFEDRDGNKLPVLDVAFAPNGRQLVAAAGDRVLLFAVDLAATGEEITLIKGLKGHKTGKGDSAEPAKVFCVAYSKQADMGFASGGADNCVIMWNDKGKGKLKFSHQGAIRALAFNPVTPHLASCSEVDFGLWEPDAKSVPKHKVAAPAQCCSWTPDGTYLAIGLANGHVTIRGLDGSENALIERDSPVWGLSWNPAIDMPFDVLAVACWDQTLSCYQRNGSQHGKTRRLGYDPCTVDHFPRGEFVVVGGSDRKLSLATKEGVVLTDIASCDSWVWAASVHTPAPAGGSGSGGGASGAGSVSRPLVAVASQDGSLSVHRVSFGAVSSHYRERHAQRSSLSDVLVQHLETEQRVRIKCRDLVQKLAMYRNRLAVQLPDRIIVYELMRDELGGEKENASPGLDEDGFGVGGAAKHASMHYRVRDRLHTKVKCDHMAVCALHLVIVQGRKLSIRSFSGHVQRVMRMESEVRIMRVLGGSAGCETILLGLASGSVRLLFLDSDLEKLPGFVNGVREVEVLSQSSPVAAVDVSCDRKQVAVLDESGTLLLYDAATQDLVLSERGVSSVAFNAFVPDSVCWVVDEALLDADDTAHTKGSGNAGGGRCTLHVRYGSLPTVAVQIGRGSTVVSFSGAKAHCLHPPASNAPAGAGANMRTHDVPQTATLCRLLEAKDLHAAYRVACLGVTEADWRELGLAALQARQLGVAGQAFVRVRDTKLLDLTEHVRRSCAPHVWLERATCAGMPTAAAGVANGNTPTKRKSADAAGAAAGGADLCARAHVLAFEGRYTEAATAFAKADAPDQAIEMYSDLRQWEDAKSFAQQHGGGGGTADLLARQAAWAEQVGDWRAAAQMHQAGGSEGRMRAIRILGDKGGWKDLAELARGLEKSAHGAELRLCAELFRGAKPANSQLDRAEEVLRKIGDVEALMALYVDGKRWESAVALAEQHSANERFSAGLFLPYAEWLVTKDRFDEALVAFEKAGAAHRCVHLLEMLSASAVIERRYLDAAYYLRALGAHVAKGGGSAEAEGGELGTSDAERRDARCERYLRDAALYTAFDKLQDSNGKPFTSFLPEALFHAARFVLNTLGKAEAPYGVSRVLTLFTLAKQGKKLEAFKLARYAYDRLQRLKVPATWMNQIDLDIMTLNAKPFSDREDLLPVCFRCSTTNPLLNNNMGMGGATGASAGAGAGGDRCVACGHPFVRSFTSFDHLPLVQFVPAEGISDAEAVELIKKEPGGSIKSGGDSDSFTQQLMNFDGGPDAHWRQPIQADAKALLSMPRDEVYVIPHPSPRQRATFYRNMTPEMPITLCALSGEFAYDEDFQFHVLQGHRCPGGPPGSVYKAFDWDTFDCDTL